MNLSCTIRYALFGINTKFVNPKMYPSYFQPKTFSQIRTLVSMASIRQKEKYMIIGTFF